jgi:hypothetical protein
MCYFSWVFNIVYTAYARPGRELAFFISVATPGLNILYYTLKSPFTKQLLRGAK